MTELQCFRIASWCSSAAARFTQILTRDAEAGWTYALDATDNSLLLDTDGDGISDYAVDLSGATPQVEEASEAMANPLESLHESGSCRIKFL